MTLAEEIKMHTSLPKKKLRPLVNFDATFDAYKKRTPFLKENNITAELKKNLSRV